ncbi:MAG TPA: hypothetical protein VMI54_18720 [Polyangiaceae bacterium]|nr:hypothetical protein [Polyangiaceae bacterium]
MRSRDEPGERVTRRRGVLAWGVVLALSCLDARTARAEPLLVDRTVVRFEAPELGGARSPRFVTARLLAFEARVEALADPDRTGAAYRERHVSAALERHVAETLLASLRIEPEPTSDELRAQTDSARRLTEERVGGPDALRDAAAEEGIGQRELVALFQRQARASLYLDRMVAPMLSPSDAELRALFRNEKTPYRDAPFETVLPGLRRWYVSTRLQAALAAYYQNARSRLRIVFLSDDTGDQASRS